MYWRIKRAEFEKQKGEKNKRAMKKMVQEGFVPGLIGYLEEEPVGWCSLGPREVFPVLARSRILKPIDDRQVWSVVCFFIQKKFRRKGLSVALLKSAVDYARMQGARIIEGYPVEPRKKMADVFVWTGLAGTFKDVGFEEKARRSPTRPIMRYVIQG
jgi:GNAT superfamily N-acetyltransferase